VTVVATGLGGPVGRSEPEQPRSINRGTEPSSEEANLDRPAVIRKQAANERASSKGDQDMEYLDIPAFLRRQAD
jgi:cell division protein FtsZ